MTSPGCLSPNTGSFPSGLSDPTVPPLKRPLWVVPVAATDQEALDETVAEERVQVMVDGSRAQAQTALKLAGTDARRRQNLKGDVANSAPAEEHPRLRVGPQATVTRQEADNFPASRALPHLHQVHGLEPVEMEPDVVQGRVQLASDLGLVQARPL